MECPLCSLSGIGLTTGRETEAGWGGGHGLVFRVVGLSSGCKEKWEEQGPSHSGVGGKKTRAGLPPGATGAGF